MDEIRFSKMHGAGNDFILLNCLAACPNDPPALAKRLCDRHTGIGADGLVLVMPSGKADFRMRIFNADGSEAEMCGNAARCVGKFVRDKRLTADRTVHLETMAGVRTLLLHETGNATGRVTVDMGIPEFSPERIPVVSDSPESVRITTSQGIFTLTAVSIGNPHGVVFCRLPEGDISVPGRELENAPAFPERANIEFVEVADPSLLKARVWERGCGETPACGTGACAALAAGAATGRCGRKTEIVMPGGRLEAEWKRDDGRIYLTGPAVTVFEGSIAATKQTEGKR